MSHEASGWAFRQELPAKVKMVLVALADQANEETGHVCYGQRHMKFLARKSACSERTLYRYLAALIRNGYLIKDSGKAKGHENDLYLRLDRSPSQHAEWTWKAGDPEADEPQDIGSAKTDDENKASENWHTPSANKVAESDSFESTKNLRPADEKPLKGFSRQAQELERATAPERVAATKPVEGEIPGWTFVIEGTRWWALLVAHHRTIGKPINSTQRGNGKYRGKTGRYVRNEVWQTILKPHSTAPPPADPLSDESTAAIKKAG